MEGILINNYPLAWQWGMPFCNIRCACALASANCKRAYIFV